MSRRNVVVLGLVGLLAGCTVAVGLAAGGSGQITTHGVAADRRDAKTEAARLLAEVVVPSGARSVKQEPRGRHYELGKPWEGAIFAAQIDRHAFWKTPASPAAVVASFQAHPPAGAKPLQSMSNGGWAAASYVFGTKQRFEFGPEMLTVSAVVLPGGVTGVRADALVRYLSPRPRSQRVPSTAGLVQITKITRDRETLVARIVTQRSQVRALARDVDSLPFEGHLTGWYSCGSDIAPTVTFRFRARPDGPELARVSEPAETPVYGSPCATTSLTIKGKQQASLLDGGVLLRRASRLLGVKLTG